MPDRFDDLRGYRARDIAGTHRSTAGSQAAAAIPEASWQRLERDGFVVFESVVDAEAVAAIRDDVLPRLDPPYARNNFEGLRTQRLYNVVEKTSACNALVEHPIVLGLIDRILEPNYLLSQLQVIHILPGEAPQPLHHDDAFYPWPRPRRSLGVAAIWAIDAFTADNGATVVIPGSHAWGERDPSAADELRSVVMPAGSVVFFHGTLWHGGGANRSAAPRLAVAAQYCAPFLRTQENFGLSVSRDRARAFSEHMQRMLGYSIHPPFMGFVDGVHPKRLL
jgi:ectoine hydroxylase-related dioxygenase (phytanoyl-CoA dioxygenase family)